MKTKFTIQFGDKEVVRDDLEAAIKKIWTDEGNKAGDIKSLSVFVQPDNSIAYYVINDGEKNEKKGEYIL